MTETATASCGTWIGAELSAFCCCCRSCFGSRRRSTDDDHDDMPRPLPVVTWFGRTDPNGRRLDISSSFQLMAGPWILLVKFLLWGLVVGSFAYGWIDYPFQDPVYWFLAYLTYWTMIYAILYLSWSLLTSTCVATHNGMVNITWVMYTVAVVHGIMVVLLFWLTEYSPDTYPTITYFMVASHGGSFLCVCIDGLLVNRIPVRWTHYLFALMFAVLYLAWSLVQGLLPIDNPAKKDDDDDKSLYSILDWTNDTQTSIIVTVVCLLGAMPIFTIFFWGLSLLFGRRYVEITVLSKNNNTDIENNAEEDDDDDDDDDEETAGKDGDDDGDDPAVVAAVAGKTVSSTADPDGKLATSDDSEEEVEEDSSSSSEEEENEENSNDIENPESSSSKSVVDGDTQLEASTTIDEKRSFS